MEKLKPTIRPRSVRHAASTVRKSSRACGPSDAYLPSSLAPIQAHAHKAMKVSTSMRNGESVRPVIAHIHPPPPPPYSPPPPPHAPGGSPPPVPPNVGTRPPGTRSAPPNAGLPLCNPPTHIQHEQHPEQYPRRSNPKDWTQCGLRHHV